MSEKKSLNPLDDSQVRAEYDAWWESIQPSIDEYDLRMDEIHHEEITRLFNACHDFGYVDTGEFPTLDAVLLALDENRIEYQDNFENGYLTITGQDACHLVFLDID